MPDEQKPKKKRSTPTHTSNEVKLRHINKTYKRILLSLRYDKDADLIGMIEDYKSRREVNTGEEVSDPKAVMAIMRGE